MFIGRKYELSVLEQMYGSVKSEFAVIYGRRRVGKSTLIQEFNKDKNHIYYVGIEWSTRDNFEGLSAMWADHILPGGSIPAFDSYDKLFDFAQGTPSCTLPPEVLPNIFLSLTRKKQ